MTRLLFTSAIVFGILVIFLLVIPLPKKNKVDNQNSNPTPIVSIVPNEENIEVFSPVNLEKVSSPFKVSGRARVFENVVSIRLSTIGGKTLIQTTAYANAPDVGQFGDFEKILTYETDEEDGILEVFQASAKDGSEIDKIIIPVSF